jgi:hypothetical protein
MMASLIEFGLEPVFTSRMFQRLKSWFATKSSAAFQHPEFGVPAQKESGSRPP